MKPEPVGVAEFGGRLTASFPSQIIVDVTQDCDLSCIHCASPRFRRSEHYSGAHLDPVLNSKLAQEVSRFAENPPFYLRYAASGEPMLHPSLLELLETAVTVATVPVTLTTDGASLSREVCADLVDLNLELVDVSIDAFLADTYAQVRRGGDLSLVRSNVQELLAAKARAGSCMRIVVSFVEQPRNTGEVDDFVSFWSQEGVDDVIVRRLHSNAGSNRLVAIRMSKDQPTEVRRPCVYPWERLVLTPRGELAFCPADWSHQSVVADYRTTTVVDVWNGEFMNALRVAHRSNDFSDPRLGLCAGCPDWAATRWPSEGRAYADLVAEGADQGADS